MKAYQTGLGSGMLIRYASGDALATPSLSGKNYSTPGLACQGRAKQQQNETMGQQFRQAGQGIIHKKQRRQQQKQGVQTVKQQAEAAPVGAGQTGDIGKAGKQRKDAHQQAQNTVMTQLIGKNSRVVGQRRGKIQPLTQSQPAKQQIDPANGCHRQKYAAASAVVAQK